MSYHHQAALPAQWTIADDATTPDGRHLTGTVARVYNVLAETARRRHSWSVGRHKAPAGWVPMWVLREPWAGGSAGDRRLRDLRNRHGVAVEGLPFTAGDKSTSSWIWRLSDAPIQQTNLTESVSARVSHAPLEGQSVHLVSGPGRDRPAGAIDISPGADSPLAPSLGVADDATYRRELLSAYHGGRLVPALEGAAVLWTDADACFDPRPVLRAALTKLGATVGG